MTAKIVEEVKKIRDSEMVGGEQMFDKNRFSIKQVTYTNCETELTVCESCSKPLHKSYKQTYYYRKLLVLDHLTQFFKSIFKLNRNYSFINFMMISSLNSWV